MTVSDECTTSIPTVDYGYKVAASPVQISTVTDMLLLRNCQDVLKLGQRCAMLLPCQLRHTETMKETKMADLISVQTYDLLLGGIGETFCRSEIAVLILGCPNHHPFQGELCCAAYLLRLANC